MVSKSTVRPMFSMSVFRLSKQLWETDLRGQILYTLESAKIPFTLPMAKTKTMVLVFGFSFPFSAGFQGKSGFSFGKKWF